MLAASTVVPTTDSKGNRYSIHSCLTKVEHKSLGQTGPMNALRYSGVLCICAFVNSPIPTGWTARTDSFSVAMSSVYLYVMGRTAVEVPAFHAKRMIMFWVALKKLCVHSITVHTDFSEFVFIINGLPSYSLCCVNWIKSQRNQHFQILYIGISDMGRKHQTLFLARLSMISFIL